MKDLILYIHGKDGRAGESGHYSPLFPGCDVFGLAYQTSTPWEAGKEILNAVTRLKDKYEKLHEDETPASDLPLIAPKATAKSSIILDQVDDLAVKFAQCCNPLPGDDIIGFITRGHGISVHTTNCTNYKAVLQRNDPAELARWCDIQWTEHSNSQLQTSFEVIATDRVGLVYDISAVLMEARVPIVHSASRVLKNGNALFESTIVISSTEQLKNLFDKLRRIKGVISVERSAI